MEKYKKKSLNFMGYSRELRKTERENQRYASRQQRFSIIRMLENESITEQKEISSRIPTIGKSKDQAASRIEMLQKWKQEKMVKKQQESKLKKPAFKVGVIKPDPPPSLGSKPLFALDSSSSRFFKSSFQVSNSQLSSKRQESFNVSTTKANTKVSNSQASAKKPEIKTVNIKSGAKDIKIQSGTPKTGVTNKPESRLTKNKGSGIQYLNMKPKDQVSRNIKQPTIGSRLPLETKKIDQVSKNIKQPTIGSRPPLETKKVIPHSGLPKAGASKTLSKETKQVASSVLPKLTRTLSTEPKQIPSSGLPKASASKTLKDPKQIPSVLPKVTRTLSEEPRQAIPKKNNVLKNIPKFSKSVASPKKGSVSDRTSKSESKVPTKPESDCLTNKPDKEVAFECELSHIEPIKDERKSFAPPGFLFQPPVELNSSLFSEDGPAAIFMRVKNKYLRTSTPKQSPLSQKSSSEIEDSKCLKNEDKSSEKDKNIQCSKDEKKNEDVHCSKSADNNLGSSHKYEDLLSSSLETVCLNDAKPIDCKQSLKFEFPEVVSTQNEEEMLLPSKITQPELSLAIESEAINLPDSTVIVKTEINSPTDMKPTENYEITAPLPGVDSVLSEVKFNPTHIVKPIDCKQASKFEFPEIISIQNQEKMVLSSNVKCPENSLDSEPSPNGAMNSPILPDSAKVDKTVVNSTDPECDNKIPVPFLKVDSVVPEVIPNLIEPDENSENDQRMSNGFLQKQGNSLLKFPERKIRNFRQSEKPVLSSISESLENTPKSAFKKKVLDSVFTPRRSLRLAKLSGNFSSLENLLDTPKPHTKEIKDKVGLKVDFTPRRSSRLSKFSTEFNSAENLFDVRRPTLYGSPEDETVPKIHSRVTYDFDRLSSETEEDIRPRNTRGGKVSLLYTPPNKSRPSIMRHSIRGDLMSFSPNA